MPGILVRHGPLIVFHEEGFQPAVPCQNQPMFVIANANEIYFP